MIVLGHEYIHLKNNNAKMDFLMSVFSEKVNKVDIINVSMSKVLKLEAVKLVYTEIKVIEIKEIDTHSHRYGGSDALHLSGYKCRRYKKWEDSNQKHSKNTFQTNCIFFYKGM